MIYNPKKVDNRRFKAVCLPSCRKLFERFGYSLSEKGHPDNIDPYKFTDPSFQSGVFPKDVDNSALIKGVTETIKETKQVSSHKDPEESQVSSHKDPEES